MSKIILEYSVINGIILLLILLYKKRTLLVARYFLLLYFVFILILVEQLYIFSIIANSCFTYSEFPVRFLFSALFYLYVATYLNPQYKPGAKKIVLLFLPTALDVLGCTGVSIYAYSNNLNLNQRLNLINGQPLYLIRSITAVGFSLYWNIQALKLIKKFLDSVKNVYASIDKLQTNWLKNISIINVGLWAVWLCYLIVECFHPVQRSAYIPLFLLLCIIIVVHGYFVVLKPDTAFQFVLANQEIKENNEIEVKNVTEEKNNDSKAENEVKEDKGQQAIAAAYLQQLFEQLENYMHEEKAYVNKNLSLSVIAAYLKEPPVMITKAIRYGTSDTFYNYVNRLRAIKFLEQLDNPQNDVYTIDALSYRTGFNSKTTLHKYFKALTGLTPAAAQKKLRNKEETIGSLVKKHSENQ